MNEYRGKHSASQPWAVSAFASTHYRSRHLRKNRRRKKLLVWMAVLLAVLLALPFIVARFPQVDRASLTSEDLPEDIRHLRIVFLSDVHYGFYFPENQIRSLISSVNELKPDLVLFGGDMGDNPDSAAEFFRRMPSLHARYAALGVLGEHDRGDSPSETALVTDAMREAGVTPLMNTYLPVRVGNSMIYVAGLDDVQKGQPALPSLAAQAAVEDYVIFLCHNPSVIPESQRATDRSGRLGWFDLALFGHTHGGQIRGLANLLDIAGDVDDRYLRGWLVENRSDLLISNGVGASVLPARLLCPPQIHCIDISLP